MKGDLEVYLAASIWVFCSTGMMVFNKIAINVFPLECTLVFLQMIFTVLFVIVIGWKSLHIGSLKDLLLWLRVAPFFAGVLLTGILALKDAPMSLVVVFRGLAPVLGLAIERYMPDAVEGTSWMFLSLIGMLGGVGLYTRDMPAHHLQSACWVVLNSLLVICDRFLQWLMLDRHQSPVDISKSSCTIINNLAGAIIMVIFALRQHEIAQVPEVLLGLNAYKSTMICLSCVVGAGIAYAGVWLQSLISASSFLVLATASRFAILLVEVLFMDYSMTQTQLAGASIVIVCGVLYGQAKERAVTTRSSVAKESDPLVGSSEAPEKRKI